MTDISFYQVMESVPASVDKTLPSILNKILKSGKNVVIKCPNIERMERIDDSLWSFQTSSFMPHGTMEDNFKEKQPIYLTTEDENPNHAEYLILISGAVSEDFASYERVFDMFEASEIQQQNARTRWKDLKSKGYPLSYFANENGSWIKKL